jgi:hypothetical protein
MAKNDPFEVALAQEGITGVAADVARSIYMQESSGGKNTKTSNAGGVGGMQIIPSTFKSMADKGWNINDPVHNARAGIRYINQLHGKADGDPALTAVGYYGGPGAMAKAREGIAVRDPRNPDAPDTLAYSEEVLKRLPNNEGYTRITRAPVAVGTPIPAPVDTQPIPTDIPAYHGVPDQWSRFGRALPQEQVAPQDLNFGQESIPQALVKPIETGIFASLMPGAPTAAAPMMQAFKGWGKR